MIFLQTAVPLIEEILILGWLLLGTGGLISVSSIITLHKKGTSKITDCGLYGIIRHPMYLGGLIMFLSHSFFGQNWVIILNSVIGSICCYLIILSGDQRNIEKFGEDYNNYMKKVPRINFIIGIKRYLQNNAHANIRN
jgi:protein-S-isoprenylcysteine O-methyltransferase Ste14